MVLVSFMDFLKPLSCLLPELNKLPSRMENFTSHEDIILFPFLCNIWYLQFPSKMKNLNPEETATQGMCGMPLHSAYIYMLASSQRVGYSQEFRMSRYILGRCGVAHSTGVQMHFCVFSSPDAVFLQFYRGIT